MKVITIHNYQEATKQEIFDFVANHLLTQNEKSTIGNSIKVCQYRTEKDNKVLKCAAGCLIPDEDYNKEFEGKIWNTIGIGKFISYVKDTENDSLIRQLQIIHDNYNPYGWKEKLILLAEKENLQVNF